MSTGTLTTPIRRFTDLQRSWINHYNRFHESFEWFIEKELGHEPVRILSQLMDEQKIEEAQTLIHSIYRRLSKDITNNPYVRGLNHFMWLVNTDIITPERSDVELAQSILYSEITY